MPCTKVVVWQQEDGAIAVTVPHQESDGGDPMLEGESEEMYLDRHALSLLSGDPVARRWRRLPNCEKRNLPPNRWFDAWRWNGAKLYVDMDVARAVKIRELRSQRNLKLQLADMPEQEMRIKAAHVKAIEDVGLISTLRDLDAYQPLWPV